MLVFHEFGDKEKDALVLIHALGSPWQLWQLYIEELQKTHRVIVPSLEGYNNDGSPTKGIAYNAKKIAEYLLNNGVRVRCVIGLSFGANIVLKILALQCINIPFAIADASYLLKEPDEKTAAKIAKSIGFYRYARPFKRLLIRSFAKNMDKANATLIVNTLLSIPVKYLQADMFDYFNFTIAEDLGSVNTHLALWCDEKEADKIENAKYIKSRFTNVECRVFSGYDHGEFFISDPKGYLKEIYRVLS
ncbi:MAG: alpha/beta fold hydrolase [Oscillospiraceae bacterium]